MEWYEGRWEGVEVDVEIWFICSKEIDIGIENIVEIFFKSDNGNYVGGI